ncbi:hypothetical protein JTE88_08310 [Arcanobacterium phocisimile]|uniref:Phage MuF C-terminal domain-containing protein n=1 Tax=Arcanobacterium phocisimile TaxID=1302235 RepID=A0ABX7IG80_9ACTO|nr:hypothetical protein [Arcanobacterium phocisimile]QRV02062.1 hypothetical protein JTE88_08310 [Arcanobacterium phocisimile]
MLSIIARYEDSIRRPQEQRWTLVTGQPQWRSTNHLDQQNPVQGIKPLDFDKYYQYAEKCFHYLPFGHSVDRVLSYTYAEYDAVFVCRTPLIYKNMGWSSNNIFHTQKHIHKEVEPEPQGHGLSAETLKQLPELLEKPAAVFNSLTKANAYTALLDAKDNAGRVVLVALQPDGRAYYRGRYVNDAIALSVYGRNNIVRFIQRNIEENTVRYINPEILKRLIPIPELQLLGSNMSLDQSISQLRTAIQSQTRDDLASRISERSSNHSTPFQVSPSISPERPKLWTE